MSVHVAAHERPIKLCRLIKQSRLWFWFCFSSAAHMIQKRAGSRWKPGFMPKSTRTNNSVALAVGGYSLRSCFLVVNCGTLRFCAVLCYITELECTSCAPAAPLLHNLPNLRSVQRLCGAAKTRRTELWQTS